MANFQVKALSGLGAIEVAGVQLQKAIVRNGTEVVGPTVNDSKVDAYVDKLVPVTRFNVPRVLSQSVPAGTSVVKGTSVDLVLVPPADVNLGLFDDSHLDLQTRTIADLAPILDDSQVSLILNKYSDAASVSQADKEILTGKLASAQVNVNDSAGRTFNQAFNSLKGAQAFL